MTRISDSAVREALRLAGRGHRIAPGWRVINDPLDGKLRCSCPAGSDCTRPGKHTWLARSWYLLASSEPTAIVPWFTRRASSILLLMGGPTRTIALDVDGLEGEHSLAQLERELDALPPTLTQTTGRGRHLLFRVGLDHEIERIRNRVAIAPGIDIRAERGYIRVGGLHVSGVQYQWVDPATRIAALPAAWFERLVARSTRSHVALRVAARDRPPEHHLPSLEERIDRARAYIEKRPAAVSGERGHDALWTVALDLVRRFVVPPEIAIQFLDEEYSPRCKPGWSDTEIAHKVESALSAVEAGWAALCGFAARVVDAGDGGGRGAANESTVITNGVNTTNGTSGYKGSEPAADAALATYSAEPDRIVLADDPDPVCYCSARIARVELVTDVRLDVHVVIVDEPYARLPLLLPISTTERRAHLVHATRVESLDDPYIVVGAPLRVEVIRRDGCGRGPFRVSR